MSLYTAVRPLLFKLPPETAHNLGKKTIKLSQRVGPIRAMTRATYQYEHPMLEVELFDLHFPNPVGIAAGFDKDGEVMGGIYDLGFGFTEIGTVTPRSQEGNPKPRLFRLPADEGMINRLAFNGQGATRVRQRLEDTRLPPIPISVNIGKMNDSSKEEAIEDYCTVFETLYDYPEYFVLNVSCPNTPEEYDERDETHLSNVFSALADVNTEDKPLLVKVSPDADRVELETISKLVEEFDLAGIVAANTTEDREGLKSAHQREWGGLSGVPLEEKATKTVRTLYELTDVPIIGVGGVHDGKSAYRRIKAGASLVQLYTGFVYRGPSTAREINAELVKLLKRDGFNSVKDAVGADAE